LVATLRISQITADLTEELRHLVLWPDKPLDYVRLDEDKYGYHFGAFVPCRDKPVAVISIFFEPIPLGTNDRTTSGHHGTSVRFRKFACHPEFQGQGIGTSLLRYAASYCSSNGATIFWCDARLSSGRWYERRGLVPFGDTFFKDTVEYTRMKMVLVDSEAERQLGSQRGVVS
ncbi:acyl-CoA N-acyltransferase, partial [Imleria badia]